MNPEITTGVEMEVWVVDEEGRLDDGDHLADAHERIKPEFIGPLLEVQTEPRDSMAGLERDLQEVLSTAIQAAEADGKRLVPLGTPLTAADASANCERGRLFEDVFGEGVVSAKNCAGTHMHFEKTDVLRQLNLLTALDPAVALVSSSPYYLGERENASSRAKAYRTECGPAFRKYCDLWNYVGGVDEWAARVDRQYEEFVRLASERGGVAPEAIEEHFDPEDTMLNPVRLRRCQPTVEWRAPDSALPSQLLGLASDARALVDRVETTPLEFGEPGVGERRIGLPEFPELWELSQRAIDGGLDSRRVRAYLEAMGFDPDAYSPIAGRLYGPPTLSEPTAREIRLEYARRLREDVESLTADPPAAISRRRPQSI
jgi:hypothetical protein